MKPKGGLYLTKLDLETEFTCNPTFTCPWGNILIQRLSFKEPSYVPNWTSGEGLGVFDISIRPISQQHIDDCAKCCIDQNLAYQTLQDKTESCPAAFEQYLPNCDSCSTLKALIMNLYHVFLKTNFQLKAGTVL